jgi:hypothetical protein
MNGRWPNIGIPRVAAGDPDAAAYIAAVEAADGQALEAGVRTAINGYVVALKSAGLWSAITYAYLFCGARTFAGAILPLKGGRSLAAINMAAGDYNRRRMRGDGIAKRFNVAGSTGADLPANNMHSGVKISELSGGPSVCVYMGSSAANLNVEYHIQMGSVTNLLFARLQQAEGNPFISANTFAYDAPAISVIGSRSSSTTAELYGGTGAVPIPNASDTATLAGSPYPLSIFDAPPPASTYPTKADILYASFGTALNATAYAAVIDTHIAAILTAIP